MASKWLDWTPDRDEIEKSSNTHLSKPSELGSDGFEGKLSELFSILQGHEEGSQSGADAIEKAGDDGPSKPSEHPASPVPPLVTDDGCDLWPLESIVAERRFGQSHAMLFPFLGRKVRTPDGTGTLLQVFADRVTVLLDSDLHKCAVFPPGAIRVIAATGDD